MLFKLDRQKHKMLKNLYLIVTQDPGHLSHSSGHHSNQGEGVLRVKHMEVLLGGKRMIGSSGNLTLEDKETSLDQLHSLIELYP